MRSNFSGPRGSTVSPRVALLSIVGFWLVYFTIATTRSVVLAWGHQTEMLAARAFVTVGSMLATYIVYLAIRPLASRSLAVNVTAIALLAIPASIAYSSMNWIAFQQLDKRVAAEKMAASHQFIVATQADIERLRDQAQVARDAVQAIREARRQSEEEARQVAKERAEAMREKAEAVRMQAAAKREAAQGQTEEMREASRERAEAAREAARDQRQAAEEARRAIREAVQEARRNGVVIDIPDIQMPQIAASPAAPAAPNIKMPAMPKIASEPPMPPLPDIPIPVIPKIVPQTMTIQVGQPGNSHQEEELTPIGQIADQAMNGYFFYVAWGALFLALSYAGAVRIAEREAANYRAAARDAELRALRYQVNPHFLFNTLNSLSTLILKDQRDEAEQMILNLATFFRTSLTADPTEDVLLSEEIRLQRLYLDIEAIRFPERLNVRIVVPPSLLTACVPCLILQPLVENAIKYGVSRSKRPVTVVISAREDSQGLVLTVEDDGDPIEDGETAKGTGVGLKNVTERLKARFGDDAACRHGPLPNGGFSVTLFMPLVRDGC